MLIDPERRYILFGRSFQEGAATALLDLRSHPYRVRVLENYRAVGLSSDGSLMALESGIAKLSLRDAVAEPIGEPVVPPFFSSLISEWPPSNADETVLVFPAYDYVTVVKKSQTTESWTGSRINIPLKGGGASGLLLTAGGELLAVRGSESTWTIFDVRLIGSEEWQRSEVLKRAEEKLERCLRKREIVQVNSDSENSEALKNDGAVPGPVKPGYHRCPLGIESPSE